MKKEGRKGCVSSRLMYDVSHTLNQHKTDWLKLGAGQRRHKFGNCCRQWKIACAYHCLDASDFI